MNSYLSRVLFHWLFILLHVVFDVNNHLKAKSGKSWSLLATRRLERDHQASSNRDRPFTLTKVYGWFSSYLSVWIVWWIFDDSIFFVLNFFPWHVYCNHSNAKSNENFVSSAKWLEFLQNWHFAVWWKSRSTRKFSIHCFVFVRQMPSVPIPPSSPLII